MLTHLPPHAVPAHNSLRELLDGGGGKLAGVLRALPNIGCTGVSLRTVLESTITLYKSYREGILYRDEDEC